MRIWTTTRTTIIALTLAFVAVAGDTDSPAAPSNPASAMYHLEDIYNRLDTGAAGAKRAGAFEEPTAGDFAAGAPGDSGPTLDDVMGAAPAANGNAATAGDVLSGKVFWGLDAGAWGQQTGTVPAASGGSGAAVEKTGQTTSYATGDDGDLETGVVWPSPRFTDNSDGTVTDNLTGLIWLKDADAGDGPATWANALSICNSLATGQQGLSDGSSAGDWRLPTVKELHSLIDVGNFDPALPTGHPFSGVQSSFYWSSTTNAGNAANAFSVYVNYGSVSYGTGKSNAFYVWPVRGGE